MIANGKHWKKHIFSLDNDGVKIEGQNNLKNYIMQFYKELFGPSKDNDFAFDEKQNRWYPPSRSEWK